MSNVVAFPDRKGQPGDGSETEQWASGDAKCLACRHEWPAVAPLGTTALECPECGTHRGVYKYPFVRGYGDPDRPHYTCSCGNDLFGVTPRGIYCPQCGADHRPYDQPVTSA